VSYTFDQLCGGCLDPELLVQPHVASRPGHAHTLADHALFVFDEGEHRFADDDVEMRIIKREVLCVGDPEFDAIRHALFFRPFLRPCNHAFTQVYADHAAAVFLR